MPTSWTPSTARCERRQAGRGGSRAHGRARADAQFFDVSVVCEDAQKAFGKLCDIVNRARTQPFYQPQPMRS